MARGVVVPLKPAASHPRRRRAASRPAAKTQARTGMTRAQLIEESRRWLSIINAHKLNDYKRRKIVADTLDNFRLYYNSGYLEYRKSVTEGGEFAAIEWSGRGSYFEDIDGPQVHRLPGRLRHLLGRHQPPQDRAGGEVAAGAHAALVAGAARSPARRPGRAAGRAGSGRPAGLLLHQQRHRRHRGRHEAGPPLHRQARLHLLRPRLPRQVATARSRSWARASTAWPSSRCCRTCTSCPSATPRRSSGAPQGGGGGHGHRGRGGGAGAGRGGRHRAARRLLAAAARDLHPLRRAADRGRGADGHGPHRQHVRGGALGRGARHHVPGQGAGRRGDAALGLHVHARRSGRCWSPTRSSTPRPSAATRWPARPASRRST